MKEVTYEEFYEKIGPMDVVVSSHFFPESKRMYSLFKSRRTHTIVGRVNDSENIAEQVFNKGNQYLLAEEDQ